MRGSLISTGILHECKGGFKLRGALYVRMNKKSYKGCTTVSHADCCLSILSRNYLQVKLWFVLKKFLEQNGLLSTPAPPPPPGSGNQGFYHKAKCGCSFMLFYLRYQLHVAFVKLFHRFIIPLKLDVSGRDFLLSPATDDFADDMAVV